MANDMDMDMDIDLGLTDDLNVPEIDIDVLVNHTEPEPILSTPNDTSEPNAQDTTPHKVHLRGLDNLTTGDIKTFAFEYYDNHKPLHVEWIDDTSANLVYDSPEIAAEALQAFAIGKVAQLFVLQTVQAKPFPGHKETNLLVRLAVAGDRKQAGARERSRFYLFNPEYDPAERRKRGGGGPRKYREREDGGYRSQRYDDHEQRKRERDTDFDASLYDDDASAIAKRAGGTRSYREGSSGTDSRDRVPRGRGRYNGHGGKELFPAQGGRDTGRLRNRSASPSRDYDGDEAMAEARDAETRKRNYATAKSKLEAQKYKAQLKESCAKELFPQKNHCRSDAFDAADETADLFANSMALKDRIGESRPRNGGSLASRVTKNLIESETSGFSIRGAAKSSGTPSQSFNIKGAAGVQARELFPSSLGDNQGKELFSERLEGRGQRRQKAQDLFF